MRVEVALLQQQELLTRYPVPRVPYLELFLVEALLRKLLRWMMGRTGVIPNLLDGVFREIRY